MMSSNVAPSKVDRLQIARTYAPGLVISLVLSIFAYFATPWVALLAPIPTIVIALLVGMALNPIAAASAFEAGMSFSVKKVLRWSVALLGFRVSISDITALGFGSMVVTLVSMAGTLLAGFCFARFAKKDIGFGALIGVGTAVCGASATLAASTVIPDYKGKQLDIVFTVVALNALATVAMLIYPPLCLALGFDSQATGVMLGATIHDVAQVAGAGYSVSTDVGNAAVIVKLFRVFLLLPIVLIVGWYFSKRTDGQIDAKVPVPGFALLFLLFCVINSIAPTLSFSPLSDAYPAIQKLMIQLSGYGLLLAISALGLGTSIKAIVSVGWRHVAAVIGTTAVILVFAVVGLMAIN